MNSASRSLSATQRGARMPIGRGDVGGVRSGLAELDKTGAAGIEARRARGEMTCRNRGESGDALAPRGKGVAQFAGHGDRVTVGAAQLSMEGVEGGVEAVEAEPKRRRSRKRRFDPPVLHARRFQMRSADVPTDDDAHRSSRFDASDARSEQSGRSSAPRARAPVAGRGAEPYVCSGDGMGCGEIRQRSQRAGSRRRRRAHLAARAPRLKRGSSRARLAIVKLGGSHANGPHIKDWLAAIAAEAGAIVIVPGGGPFADAVRSAQASMGYDDSAAHAMALMAMAQFGRALMSLNPALRMTASRSAISRALKDGKVPVWSPETMARAAALPETWALTSDSLAAWLAGALGAGSSGARQARPFRSRRGRCSRPRRPWRRGSAIPALCQGERRSRMARGADRQRETRRRVAAPDIS